MDEQAVNAGISFDDGYLGRYGRCSVCGRQNKVVGPLDVSSSQRRCIIPSRVKTMKIDQRPKNGCDAQKGINQGLVVSRSS